MKEFIRMSPTEKMEYMEKIDHFAEEVLPRLLARTEVWTSLDLKDYYDGVELLTAWRRYAPQVDTFRTLSPKKYITSLQRYVEQVRNNSELGQMKTISASDKRRFYANVHKESEPDENGIIDKTPIVGKVEDTWKLVDGRLPKELALYKHLLSPRMQQESTRLPELYSEFSYASDTAKELALKGEPKEKIAVYTQRAIAAQNAISDIWEKIDIEKFAIEKEAAEGKKPEPKTTDNVDPIVVPGKSKGSYTRQEIEQMKDPVFQTECRLARIEANQKYISREDVNLTPKNIEKRRMRIQELEEWGISVDKKYKQGLYEKAEEK